MERIQSASSINTYKQCNRKYYYNYIEKLPTIGNIHLILGGVVHEVLEKFFKIDIKKISKESYQIELKAITFDLLRKAWLNKRSGLKSLKLENEQIGFYFEEAKGMIDTWTEKILENLDEENLVESFKKLKPETEEEIVSDKFKIKGYLDAVYDREGKVEIWDYKTSSRDELKDEYKLQLAIYALLYIEKNGKKPSKVGINFLRHGEKSLEVDEELLDLARREVGMIHEKTKSEEIKDYPKSPGPLCKWGTGQCDFYEVCKPFEG